MIVGGLILLALSTGYISGSIWEMSDEL